MIIVVQIIVVVVVIVIVVVVIVVVVVALHANKDGHKDLNRCHHHGEEVHEDALRGACA